MVLYSDDERKLNREVVFALLGAQMLQMGEFGAHLAKQMDGGRNVAVVSFAMALVRHCLLDERTVIASDCKELLTSLAQLAQAGQGPEGWPGERRSSDSVEVPPQPRSARPPSLSHLRGLERRPLARLSSRGIRRRAPTKPGSSAAHRPLTWPW